MSVLEGVLVHVEMYPCCDLYRLGIGFCLVPAFVRYSGAEGADWRLLPFFVFVLVTIRLVPVLVRHLVPFSNELQARWSSQRILAKRFDSYQWRKLFWFGLGLAVYEAWFRRAGVVPIVLATGCLCLGSLGAVAWQRHVRANEEVADLVAWRKARPE